MLIPTHPVYISTFEFAQVNGALTKKVFTLDEVNPDESLFRTKVFGFCEVALRHATKLLILSFWI